jgi:hypothetical protein
MAKSTRFIAKFKPWRKLPDHYKEIGVASVGYGSADEASLEVSKTAQTGRAYFSPRTARIIVYNPGGNFTVIDVHKPAAAKRSRFRLPKQRDPSP